jgi:hypothetical protein
VKRRYLLAVAIVFAGAAALLSDRSEERAPSPPEVMLGITNTDGRYWLTRVAPESLRPLAGRRLRLRAPLEGWALSPDDGTVALVTGRAASLRLVALDGMREVARIPTTARGTYASVIWPRRDRLWIVLSDSACCAVGETTVVTVDVQGRRVLTRHTLDGGLARVAPSQRGPVLLLAPSKLLGPARLVSVDAAGAVRQLPLSGVSAGMMPTEMAPTIARVRTPGLAVEPEGRRAFVVSSAPWVIEADLRRGRVDAHRLVAHTSLRERLGRLLVPDAQAATQVGAVREAAWIGDGRIAFSGHDSGAVWRPDEGLEAQTWPAGLQVIDTRDWRVRTLDEDASTFVAAGELLVTGGERGLIGYAPAGERFRVLDARPVEIVASAGSLVYARRRGEPALQVVDAARGRVVGTVEPGRATPLERASAAR